jgi:hypothetical protein
VSGVDYFFSWEILNAANPVSGSPIRNKNQANISSLNRFNPSLKADFPRFCCQQTGELCS